jgi:drug/metabolite transporter (DMT)-like permease
MPDSSTRLKTALALAAVYLIWGSTYLAIKIAVATIPPLLAAGTRFLIAGALLYAWGRLRGAAAPERGQWPRLWLLGTLMFLIVYSALFWAEKIIPSGLASVLVATLPAWTLLLEVTFLKTQKLTLTLIGALITGLLGVILVAGNIAGPNTRFGWIPCAVVLISEVSWAAGSILSKRMTLPVSHTISAGAQMLCGGVLLLVCSALIGEWRGLNTPPLEAIVAMAYLILAGSLAAYSSYVWLLGRMSPTRLSSYAYVNPVVALILGITMGGEVLRANAIFGSILVLASVVLILSAKQSTRHAQVQSHDTERESFEAHVNETSRSHVNG